jgi:hypothetical protein
MFFYVSSLIFPGLYALRLIVMNPASAGFFSADNLLDFEQSFSFSQFHNAGQPAEDGLVVKPMTALRPLGLADKTHRGVVVNGLS